MKVTLIIDKVEVKKTKLVVSVQGAEGTLELDNAGSAAKARLKTGDKIEVTLSAENHEQLMSSAKATISGRFHGVVTSPAESGADARSVDAGG